MNTKKRNVKALVALVLVLVMVLTPVIGVMPTFAYNKNDAAAPGAGSSLPESAVVYDGTPSEELSGSGTADDPYLIADAADFMFFRKNMAAEAEATWYFKLTGDIYLNDADYGTEGKHNAIGAPTNFAGVLDGDGHTIYNMYDYVGGKRALFDVMSGTVKNLNFDGVRMIGSHNKASVAITVSGTIEYVTVKNIYLKAGSIHNGDNNSSMVGAIASEARDGALIRNCLVESGTLTGCNRVGGILGRYSDENTFKAPVDIINCVNNATVISTASSAGGIIGFVGAGNGSVSGVNVVGCKNNGDITGKTHAAGISAAHSRVRDYINFDYCVNTGKIVAQTEQAAGILGTEVSGGGALSANTYLRNCTNYGDIEAKKYAGGLTAHHSLASRHLYITDCANYGKVDGETASGGLSGIVSDEYGNGGHLKVVNSANYGAVGSAGTSNISGGLVGQFSFSKVNVVVDGGLFTGNVTGMTVASALVGTSHNGATQNIIINDTWIQGELSVTDPVGKIGVFFGTTTVANVTTLNLKAVNSGFDLTFKVGGTAVEAADIPSGYYADGTTVSKYNDGTAAVESAYPVAATATFAETALASLNTASGGEYQEWIADDTYVAIFKSIALVITNEAALNHGYNGDVIEVSYQANDDAIKTVEVAYYNTADLNTPLSGAPAIPGNYRVVLQGKDATGADRGEAVTCDYKIDKGSVRFVILSKPENMTSVSDYTGQFITSQQVAFTGSAFVFTAKAQAYTNQRIGEDLTEEIGATSIDKLANNAWLAGDYTALRVGTYRINFVFAETDLYKAATGRIKLQVTKGTVSYPAADADGRWTLETNDVVTDNIYSGLEKKVVFNSLNFDADAFDVDLTGDIKATDVTADGVTLKATATLTLKESYSADCEITGTAPTYEYEWRIEKAPTKLVLYGPDDQPIADPEAVKITFDGAAHIYVVKLLDENNDILKTLDPITVQSVGTTNRVISVEADGVDANHSTPAPLTVKIEVESVKFAITVNNFAGRDFNGEALEIDGVTYDMTDPTDSEWSDYVPTWEKWNATTEEWEVIADAPVNAGTYRLHVTRALADGAVDCAGEGWSEAVEINKIKPTIDYDINTEVFTFELNQYVTEFDGAEKKIGALCADPHFVGTISVEYKVAGAEDNTYVTAAPTACGTYTVRITFAGDENYLAADPVEPITIVIEKKKLSIPTGDDIWDYTGPKTYDGSTFTIGVVSALSELQNVYIHYDITGNTASTRGTYSAVISLYALSDDVVLTDLLGNPIDTTSVNGKNVYTHTLSWTINKADVDMSGITFTAPTNPVYTGESYLVEASGVPAYLTPSYVITRNGTVVDAVLDAGEYSITVTYVLNNSNYNDIPAGAETDTITFTVGKMVVDPADFTFTGTSAVYDGSPKFVEVENLPAFLNVTFAYGSQSVGAVDEVGTYTVVATFSVKSSYNAENYEFASATAETTLIITKKTYAPKSYNIATLYEILMSDSVATDGAAAQFVEKINAALLESSGTRNKITVANADEMPDMKAPGEYKFVVRFAGDKNHEDITATLEVTLVVKPIVAIPDTTDNGNVSITFPEGVPEDVVLTVDKVEVTDDMKDAIGANPDITFDGASLWGVWQFGAVNQDGSSLMEGECTWTIQIVLDAEAKKSADAGNYHVSKVIVKNGVTQLETFENCEYDQETGTLTLRLSSTEELNAGYAVAVVKSKTGLIAGISIGLLVVALIAVAVVIIVVMKRRKAENAPADEETYVNDDEYAGYTPDEDAEYVGTEEYTEEYAEEYTEEYTEEYVEEAPAEDIPEENTPEENTPEEDTPADGSAE